MSIILQSTSIFAWLCWGRKLNCSDIWSAGETAKLALKPAVNKIDPVKQQMNDHWTGEEVAATVLIWTVFQQYKKMHTWDTKSLDVCG